MWESEKRVMKGTISPRMEFGLLGYSLRCLRCGHDKVFKAVLLLLLLLLLLRHNILIRPRDVFLPINIYMIKNILNVKGKGNKKDY